MLLPSLALLGKGKEVELAERTNPKESRRFIVALPRCARTMREPLPLYGAGGFPGNVGNHIATPLGSIIIIMLTPFPLTTHRCFRETITALLLTLALTLHLLQYPCTVSIRLCRLSAVTNPYKIISKEQPSYFLTTTKLYP